MKGKHSVYEPQMKIFEQIHDIVEASSGADFDTDVWTKDLCQLVQDLQSKSRTILNASSPFICAMVGSTIKELGDEVPSGTVNYMTEK